MKNKIVKMSSFIAASVAILILMLIIAASNYSPEPRYISETGDDHLGYSNNAVILTEYKNIRL